MKGHSLSSVRHLKPTILATLLSLVFPTMATGTTETFTTSLTDSSYTYNDYDSLESTATNGMFYASGGKSQNVKLANITNIQSKNYTFRLSYPAAGGTAPAYQTVTLDGIGKISSSNGLIFSTSGYAASSKNTAFQSINVYADELYIEKNSTTPVNGASPFYKGAIDLSSGGYQTITGSIGKISIGSKAGTSSNTAISASGRGTNSAYEFASQTIHAAIGQIGSESSRFDTGILANFNANQTIDKVGSLYASKYGIVAYRNEYGNNGISGDTGQRINSIDTVNVDGTGQVIGLYNWSDTGNKYSGMQYIGVTKDITVQGTTAAVAMHNIGGLQLVESKNRNGVTISASGGSKNLAVNINPNINNTTHNVITETQLKGNFNIEQGDLVVAAPHKYNVATPLPDSMSVLHFSSGNWGNTTTLADNLTIQIAAGNNAEQDNTRLKMTNGSIAVNKNNVIDVRGVFHGTGTLVYRQVKEITPAPVPSPVVPPSSLDADDTDSPGEQLPEKYPFPFPQEEPYHVVDNGTRGGMYLDKIYRVNGTQDTGANSRLDIRVEGINADEITSHADAFWLLRSAANGIFANSGIKNMEMSQVLSNGKKAAGRVYLPEGLVHKYSTLWYFEETDKVEDRDNTYQTIDGKDPTDPDGDDYFKYEGNIIDFVDEITDSVIDEETSTMTGLASIPASNYFIWRQDLETLSQRLGDVREYPRQDGDWVRVYGGQNKYNKGKHYFRNDFWALQLGYDTPVENEDGTGNWIMGGALSYTDGISHLRYGGDGDSWMLTGALYGTWHNEEGDYFDLIGKVSRMHNRFKVISEEYTYRTKAHHSNWAFSLSAEYGKRFLDKDNGYFVQPQVQLQVGRINGYKYTTDNGIHVDQKAVDSVIGRAGLALGRKLEDGTWFIRADILREFDGKANASYRLEGGLPNHTRIDFRDTWGEVSLGSTWKLDQKSFAYAQLKKSFCSDVETEYRLDIGYRHMFD